MGIKIGMRISIGIKYLFALKGYCVGGGGSNDPVRGLARGAICLTVSYGNL